MLGRLRHIDELALRHHEYLSNLDAIVVKGAGLAMTTTDFFLMRPHDSWPTTFLDVAAAPWTNDGSPQYHVAAVNGWRQQGASVDE